MGVVVVIVLWVSTAHAVVLGSGVFALGVRGCSRSLPFEIIRVGLAANNS